MDYGYGSIGEFFKTFMKDFTFYSTVIIVVCVIFRYANTIKY